MSPRVLQVGVVLFPGALPLEVSRFPSKLISPTCIFTALSVQSLEKHRTTSQYALEITYLGETLDTIACTGNLHITPTRTFRDVQEGKKVDILLIPGGAGARPWVASEALKGFIKWGAENVEWVLTVCTGSWLLASTGGLDGQRATTNKAAFRECEKHTASQSVEWIAKARYVHSGKFWTASGVSAGTDMACAFVDNLCGKEVGDMARAWAEYTSAGEEEDPWAAKCGLV